MVESLDTKKNSEMKITILLMAAYAFHRPKQDSRFKCIFGTLSLWHTLKIMCKQ